MKTVLRNRIYRASAAVLFFAVFATTLDATSFVIVVTGGAFYVGGDTLTGTAPHTMTHCKIQAGRHYILTTAGLSSILHHNLKDGTSTETDKVSDFTDRIVQGDDSPYETYQALVRAGNAYWITRLAKHLSVRSEGLPIVFNLYWFEGDTPYTREADIFSTQADSRFGPVQTLSKETTFATGRIEAFAQIRDDPFLYAQSRNLPFTNPKKFIQDMLKMQSQMTPDSVGGPFTIAKLTSQSTLTWNDSSGICNPRILPRPTTRANSLKQGIRKSRGG